MYIQITTRCNMTCDHCCMSATNKGENMDRYVYMEALRQASRYGEYITIGGGEPTCHPDFMSYIDKAIELYRAGSFEMAPHIVTNGKLKTKAHKLLDYVEEERGIAVELSQDYFHDPIDESVVRRFRQHQRRQDDTRFSYLLREVDSRAGIRTVSRIMPVGRAIETMVYTEEDKDACCCETPLVDPSGTVWSCGCKKHKLGMIWQDDILDGYDRDYAHQGGRNPELHEEELLQAA